MILKLLLFFFSVSCYDIASHPVPFSLSFCQYCTPSCLTMMAGVGVADKLLKKKKQEKDNNTNL